MKALSDPNRVKVLKMLQRGTMCVCKIQDALGIAQPTVSKHLKILEDAGLVVDLAENGQQALALAKQNRYVLILMDMQMPLMNGVEATQAIRAISLNQTTPILAMTANAFDEDREACIAAGMNEHISKPVDPEKLYETLLRWLVNRGH